MDKQNVIYPNNGMPFSNKKKQIDTATWVSLKIILRKAYPKDCIVSDFNSINSLKKKKKD